LLGLGKWARRGHAGQSAEAAKGFKDLISASVQRGIKATRLIAQALVNTMAVFRMASGNFSIKFGYSPDQTIAGSYKL